MASQEIFIVAQIVVHVFIKWTEAQCLMDGRFVVLMDTCMQCHSSLKQNKSNEFTELCVSNLFKFEVSCHCESIIF